MAMSSMANGVEIIVALQWGPKDREELIKYLGCDYRTAYAWIEALRVAGAIRADKGYRWHLCRTPFEASPE